MQEKSLLSANPNGAYWIVVSLFILTTAFLNYYFFIGFGLGDDVNESIAAVNLVHDGLNPENHFHYRLLILLPRALSFRIFGISETGFIAPIFIAFLFTAILSSKLSQIILGQRAAIVTLLLFLTTPYETLCATANIPDYIAAVWVVSLSLAFVKGLNSKKIRWMFVASLFAYCGILTRLSGITVYIACLIFTLLTLKKYLRFWAAFWIPLPLYLGIHCLWSWWFAGDPFKWFWMSLLANYDVTDILDLVLWSYPRYLWARDDFGNFMFGASGWLSALGSLLVVMRLALFKIRKETSLAPSAEEVLFALIAYVLLIEFVPHGLSLTRYYSHQRIFRYMAQFSFVIYILGAYFIDKCWGVLRLGKISIVGLLLILGTTYFNCLQIAPVTFPSRDSNADYRAIRAFLSTADIPHGTVLFADTWDFGMSLPLLYPLRLQWQEVPMNSDDPNIQRQFLDSVSGGILITGGAYLPWYANQGMNLELDRIHYKIPPHWKLLMQRDAAITRWRREPLRIWRVEK